MTHSVAHPMNPDFQAAVETVAVALFHAQRIQYGATMRFDDLLPSVREHFRRRARRAVHTLDLNALELAKRDAIIDAVDEEDMLSPLGEAARKAIEAYEQRLSERGTVGVMA